MGLGRLAHVVTLLTLSFEGVSPHVPPNQFARKRMKKSKKQLENVKHQKSRTNENATHVKS